MPSYVKMIRFEQQPCTFDGVSTDVHDYFVHFEAVSLWNKWSPDEMACQLVINLRGEAQTILRFLKRNQLKDFDYLKCLLLQRFNPKERHAYFKFELKMCEVKPGENMIDFGQRFKILCHKAHPDSFHKLDSYRYFTDLFISSLDKEMARFVYFKFPKSLDEAISFAVEYESFVMANSEVQFEKPESEDDCVVSCLKSGFEKIVSAVKMFVLKRRKRKVKRCFKCSEKGHIRASCSHDSRKISEPSQSLLNTSNAEFCTAVQVGGIVLSSDNCQRICSNFK